MNLSSFLICLFIIGAWLLRCTTIFFGDWQFGSYPNSLKSNGQLRGMVFLLSATAFLISFFSMFIGSFLVTSYSSVYFSSLTHVYPFFLGSILATIVGVRQTTSLVKQLDKIWDLRKTLLVLGEVLAFTHFDLLCQIYLSLCLSYGLLACQPCSPCYDSGGACLT